jgi:hypothetical protein
MFTVSEKALLSKINTQRNFSNTFGILVYMTQWADS